MDKKERRKIEDVIKCMEITKEILVKVSENNTEEVNQTGQLRIILINLQIVGAGIAGVEPIAHRLKSIITTLHDGTDELVHKDRYKLREAISKIDAFLLELQYVCVFKYIGCCKCIEDKCHKKLLLVSEKGQVIKNKFDEKVQPIRDEFIKMYKLDF